MSVDYADDRYHLESVAWFDASRADLYRVLTDYRYFARFSSAFAESRNLPPDNSGRPWFFTRMEGCVLFWCQSMRRRGYLVLNPPDEIVAVAVREGSDFLYSRERWRLEPEGDGTRMTYHFQMEPDFWVPPLIGPFIIKRTLRAGGVDAIDRIEALAQGREPNP
ncbi:MAG: SRPBCC family protein [Woeseiaceae bacterium]|nr:SRPBCC family protein [Woeseiaceae bacterium]